jgi:hypothetical protein
VVWAASSRGPEVIRSFLGWHGDGKPEAAEHVPGSSILDLKRLTFCPYFRFQETRKGVRRLREKQRKGCGLIHDDKHSPSQEDIELSMPEMRERCAQYPT